MVRGKDADGQRSRDRPSSSPNGFLFGLFGATASALLVGRLRRAVGWFYTQLGSRLSWKGTTGGSFRSSFKEEAQKRYNRRMQEEYEEEMERVVRFSAWLRKVPHTDDEIKTAFRAKAKEFHPDQNQDNKGGAESAEAKFKEVMTSYEAIKMERKNKKP
ncbi:hypothetical protein C3L33_10811, partial [Rhododendron williamsianum]